MHRRTLLKLGVVSTVVLVVAGGAAALLSPGLHDGKLSPAGREVFRAVGRAVLDQSLPREDSPRQNALSGLLNRVDELTLALPPHAQAELSQLLSLLASAAGRRALAGLGDAWSLATETRIQQSLQQMRLSGLVLRRQAYAALHDITAAAYFSDASTIPAALDRGAQLLTEMRVKRFELANGKVTALHCRPVMPNSAPLLSVSVRADTKIIANHYVLAGGAINSPAVLLGSNAPDPHGLLGARTFLHPVGMSSGVFEQKVEAWSGAPQTIYTDYFLDTQAIDGPMGYKLEAPPLHPIIFASTASGFGQSQQALLESFPHNHTLLALMRDGFHDQSRGGKVKLRADGSAVLDYPLTDYVMDGARRALLSMAEIQFAAGARQVLPLHEMARPYASWGEGRDAVNALPMKPLLTKVVSAHVMGGCGLGSEEKRGVTRPDGVHWQLDNLSVHDDSIFPTSIGANPQLSIYGSVNRLAQGLVKRLTGRDVALV